MNIKKEEIKIVLDSLVDSINKENISFYKKISR